MCVACLSVGQVCHCGCVSIRSVVPGVAVSARFVIQGVYVYQLCHSGCVCLSPLSFRVLLCVYNFCHSGCGCVSISSVIPGVSVSISSVIPGVSVSVSYVIPGCSCVSEIWHSGCGCVSVRSVIPGVAVWRGAEDCALQPGRSRDAQQPPLQLSGRRNQQHLHQVGNYTLPLLLSLVSFSTDFKLYPRPSLYDRP